MNQALVDEVGELKEELELEVAEKAKIRRELEQFKVQHFEIQEELDVREADMRKVSFLTEQADHAKEILSKRLSEMEAEMSTASLVLSSSASTDSGWITTSGVSTPIFAHPGSSVATRSEPGGGLTRDGDRVGAEGQARGTIEDPADADHSAMSGQVSGQARSLTLAIPGASSGRASPILSRRTVARALGSPALSPMRHASLPSPLALQAKLVIEERDRLKDELEVARARIVGLERTMAASAMAISQTSGAGRRGSSVSRASPSDPVTSPGSASSLIEKIGKIPTALDSPYCTYPST
ncbi:hypothetical protein BDK51DRAFT_47781 [Blyttiomyces helicus]|uniref:Uncharacterized protein n=1 Tax=Blyttiomyces helicus TaxID=388810 RepID=A0A4P9VZK4_9FUNG|nr:hypothetical protein BDK51DRAFT_47781 [Blyttiomyces helicus]|eukprot:RKO84762.1 hypothetical protein BDK51DRAFT_47781 [Blyttiomyces helicus]